MIKKLIKEFYISSYKSKISFKNTFKLINLFDDLLLRIFKRKYKVYQVNAPIVYNPNENLNERDYVKAIPKTFLYPLNDFNAQLSNGSRKWSRLIATNLNLSKNEILITQGKRFNFDVKIDESTPTTTHEMIFSLPIHNDNFRVKNFLLLVKKFYYQIFKIFQFIDKKANLNYFSNLTEKNLIIVDLNNINCSNEEELNKELTKLVTDNNKLIMIHNIANTNQIFYCDVYDWNYFVRFYGYNVNCQKFLKLMEMSFTVNKSIKKQYKIQNPNIDYNKFYYYWLVYNEKLLNLFQIKLNMEQIYTFLLDKYSINEVCSSILDNKTSLNYKENKIMIL